MNIVLCFAGRLHNKGKRRIRSKAKCPYLNSHLGALDIMSATENVDPVGSCKINSFIMAFISKTIAWAATITSSNSTFPPCSMFTVSEGV